MANETERSDWSGPMGQAWVRRQPDLDALMAPVSDLVLARAGLAPGATVLDVGCGAGATTLEAARAVGPDGRATGIDLSPPLLALARERARAAGLAATFLEADAQSDPIAGAPFDAIVSRFGVMFFADPVAAFANLARHMAPGATLTVAAWAEAARNPWFAIPARVAESVVGPAPPGDPDAPGPAAFRDPGRVVPILRRAGLVDVEGELVTLHLPHPGGPAALAALAVEIGPAARAIRLAGGNDAARAAVRDGIEAALAPFATPQGVALPAGIMLYRARA